MKLKMLTSFYICCLKFTFRFQTIFHKNSFPLKKLLFRVYFYSLAGSGQIIIKWIKESDPFQRPKGHVSVFLFQQSKIVVAFTTSNAKLREHIWKNQCHFNDRAQILPNWHFAVGRKNLNFKWEYLIYFSVVLWESFLVFWELFVPPFTLFNVKSYLFW